MLSSESISPDTKPAYIVWIIVLSIYGVTAILTETPQNLALVVGNRGYMNCTSNVTKSNFFNWLRGTSSIAIAACFAGSSPIPGYSWEATTPNSCNLIILNVTTDQAGVYTCAGADDQPAQAQLIVLERDPQCITEPQVTVNISDTIAMSCSTRYHGSLGPVMMWYDANEVIRSDNVSSANLSNYVIKVSPTIPTVPGYTCNTSFNSVPPGSGAATANNIPSYTSSCSTEPLSVQYPPYAENITIKPTTSKDFHLGEVLICSAVANPPVTTYLWSNDSAVLVIGDSLTLDQTGDNVTYICTVTNLLGSNSTEVVINVIPIPETTTSTLGSQSSITSSSSGSGGQTTSSSDRPDECRCSSDCVGLGIGLGIPLAISLLLNGLGITMYAYKYRNTELMRTSAKLPEKESFEDVTVSSSDADRNQSEGFDHTSQYEKLRRYDNQQPVVYDQLTINNATTEYDKR